MPRKLTATTGMLLALALATAGCGKNDSGSGSAAQSATTTPAVTTTTPATGSKASKTTGSKVSKATDAQTPAKTKTSGSKKTTTTKSTATPKAKTTAKTTTTKPKPKVTTSPTPVPAVTPKSGSDLTSGTGSGPIADREDVVAVLRRYYKAFIDKDGSAVCSLLTSEGRKIMISDGNGKNCDDSAKKLIGSASAGNFALLQRTRDGLHADDVKVTGNNATAQIGKTSALRLVQQNGSWLLRSPDVVVS